MDDELGRSVASVRPPASAPVVRPPLWCFAGGGAPALSMLPLARALPADQPVHAWQAPGYEGRAWPDWSVAGAATRALRTIRRTTPCGPFPLVGHSFGGLLALEVAARLTAAGQDVPFVMLLDTVVPPTLPAAPGAPAPVGDDRPIPEPMDGPAGASAPDLRSRLAMHLMVAGAGLVEYSPGRRDAVFWERSLRMTNRHRPRPWSGRVILVMAGDNPDDPRRWETVLTGPFEVHRVAGGHSSIMRPPFNAPIAQLLLTELDAVAPGAAVTA
ncbi:thioesterase domain-containing protein [Nakamurella leprariae]|uniref:Alpha/beta fold hydrolase n=1 Tax=Nakamurella leprariae TaxID=2803911 RepID=A0A938YFL2_9ACTN|nr:alpha/beta fold hydrolase [Nakamurella leprariae]MBM9468979.1 alpha/beta fold hydrolase [Nakamurella leprariae]